MRTLWLGLLWGMSGIAAAAGSQPGLYEVTVQMNMKGLPMQMPAMRSQTCITEADTKQGDAYVPKDSDCTITGFKQSGAKVRYDFVCKVGGSTLKGYAAGTSSATAYEVNMNGKLIPAMHGVSEFSQRISGKRLGACP